MCKTCKQKQQAEKEANLIPQPTPEQMELKDNIQFINAIATKETLEAEEVQRIVEVYNKWFNVKLKPCFTCAEYIRNLRSKLIEQKDIYNEASSN